MLSAFFVCFLYCYLISTFFYWILQFFANSIFDWTDRVIWRLSAFRRDEINLMKFLGWGLEKPQSILGEAIVSDVWMLLVLHLLQAQTKPAVNNAQLIGNVREDSSHSKARGGAGGRTDDEVVTVVLNPELDRTLSVYWRLEDRWWPWWHHPAEHCGFSGSCCPFKENHYWE